MRIRFALRITLKSLAITALVGLLVAVPVGYGFVEYTTRSEFCTSCHLMVPYVDSWKESSHKNVPCVDCHYEPGILETGKGKFKALSQIAKYVTGTEGTKPWAEVSDSSCMRSGCHNTRHLEGPIDFDMGGASISFDHGPHLLEMRRSKKLRCTSCHSQIVQGEHLTVTPSTCFLCHFKSAEEDPKLGDCHTCHGPPKRPIDVGGFTFVHDDYLARGVRCQSCHSAISQGTGEVPKRRCGSCHGVAEHIERYGETEFLHRQHVTDHKVDCVECHTEITHRLPSRAPPKETGCNSCHQSGHGLSEAFYRGEGGRGADATPSAMYLARVACNGCHMHLRGDAESATVTAKEIGCLSCHGPAFDGMLGRWQTAYGGALDVAEAEVGAALAAAEAASAQDLVAALADAKHDVQLVRSDGSRGVHNPWYARRLLEAAHGKAREAWQRLDAGHVTPPLGLGAPAGTGTNCASLCHLGIEQQPITVAGTLFDHGQHVVSPLVDCVACHSSGAHGATTGEHGKTLPKARDCKTCHHGPDAPAGRTCASCHRAEDEFLRGSLAGAAKPVQIMANVACVECHGDPPGAPVAQVVQENCVRCHSDKHEDTLEEWTDYVDEWYGEAEEAIAPLRKGAAGGSEEAREALARAEAVLRLIRRGVPAHNILMFEEQTEAFAEACEECEAALR